MATIHSGQSLRCPRVPRPYIRSRSKDRGGRTWSRGRIGRCESRGGCARSSESASLDQNIPYRSLFTVRLRRSFNETMPVFHATTTGIRDDIQRQLASCGSYSSFPGRRETEMQRRCSVFADPIVRGIARPTSLFRLRMHRVLGTRVP